MNSEFDFAVLGGGIIGVATAYKLGLKYPEKKIVILEKEPNICLHQSGRNSGVIHSGIYYKPGSLKAKNCIEGYQLLLDFCKEYNIEYKLCGKLIVATNEDEKFQLENLYQRGIENKLDGIKKLTAEEAKLIEPNVKCLAAIHLPMTGITNYTWVAAKMLELFLENSNHQIIYHYEVSSFDKNDQIIVKSKNKSIKTNFVINCTGLHSDEIGKKAGDNITHKIIPFKGEFYKLDPKLNHTVNGLIYPVPNPDFPFLGVHVTKMIDGNVKAGPNAILAFKKEGYKKNEFNLKDTLSSITYLGLIRLIIKYRKEGFEELKRSLSKKLFYKSICNVFEGVELSDLKPYTPGIRAQALYNNGKLEDDFLIKKDEKFMHIYNSPSPAATACLSIANSIVEQL